MPAAALAVEPAAWSSASPMRLPLTSSRSALKTIRYSAWPQGARGVNAHSRSRPALLAVPATASGRRRSELAHASRSSALSITRSNRTVSGARVPAVGGVSRHACGSKGVRRGADARNVVAARDRGSATDSV